MAEIDDSVNASDINDTEISGNGTTRVPATAEGMAIAYCSLVAMALIPIFVGSFRSVKFHTEQKASGEKADRMTHKDAAMFPIYASIALFGIYMFFKVFSKEYINLLLAVYFFILGILALAHIVNPWLKKVIPVSLVGSEKYFINGGKIENNRPNVEWNYDFQVSDGIGLVVCAVIGIWYLMNKHWIANNLLGLAFAVNGVEYLQLNTFSVGSILLVGLFIYDIFWVFGTEVMVTVAKSFDAPIKLVFPQDILEKGWAAKNFAMLGLGDIVIPGILIALLLRFDYSMHHKKKPYFYATYIAYFLGLAATVLVMHLFNHAQPALLYLVPACLLTPLGLALVRGELKQLFSYEDHAAIEEEENEGKDAGETSKTSQDVTDASLGQEAPKSSPGEVPTRPGLRSSTKKKD